MTVDEVNVPTRENAAVIEESLRRMMAHLTTLIEADGLTSDAFVEIMSIYNNVAYIFLYLDAIDDEAALASLQPWKAAFQRNDELDARMLALLRNCRFEDREIEASRREYISQLEKVERYDQTIEDQLQGLLTRAKEVLGAVTADQAALLARLGLRLGSASVNAAYYKLLSQTESASVREKLARAFVAQRDCHRHALDEIVDEMIELRRRRATIAGFPTVLAHTLERCRVSASDVEGFLARYLELSLEAHSRLEAEIRTTIDDDVAEPMIHLGYVMRNALGNHAPPLFRLQACLDYAFAVANAVFGLAFERVESPSPDLITVRAETIDGRAGEINFDLWDLGRKKLSANHTRGIRNRTEWRGIVQRPIAYVSCRFHGDGSGLNAITFQNVHSLFHEFGHALNHLLIKRHVSYQSGLEYLPPERLEYLSMWFEKWVYHDAFSSFLGGAVDEDDLRRCRAIKLLEMQRTFVERAVAAFLDFDVHNRSDGGLRESFERLDARFGISDHCLFGDFPAYFTWPMYMANPGASFSYLWGSADSCDRFARFRGRALDEISRKDEMPRFDVCFNFDAPSDVPPADAIFEFYGEASLFDLVDRHD